MPALVPEQFVALLQPDPDPDLWVNSMALAMANTEFANTWSQEAGSACRCVFVFENGWRLTWSGDGNGGFPGLLQAWHATDTPSDNPPSFLAGGSFTYSTRVPSWRTYTPDLQTIHDTINKFVAACGPCVVVLPWDTFLNTELPEELLALLPGAGDFLQEVSALSDDDVQSLEDLADPLDDEPSLGVVFAGLALSAVHAPTVWSVKPVATAFGDEYLIPGSPLAKFYAFAQRVEERDDWVVVWNECCGTCSRTSIEWGREHKGLPDDAPALVLFGQNAQFSWRPDSTVDVDLYQEASEHADDLAQMAQSVGLAVTREEGDPRRVRVS